MRGWRECKVEGSGGNARLEGGEGLEGRREWKVRSDLNYLKRKGVQNRREGVEALMALLVGTCRHLSLNVLGVRLTRQLITNKHSMLTISVEIERDNIIRQIYSKKYIDSRKME